MLSRTRGYLPHIDSSETIYFITFRLADSLTATRLSEWKRELQFNRMNTTDPKSIAKLEYDYYAKVQNHLDQSFGNCWLRETEIALIVDRVIRHFNNLRYQLFAWTIMPNHVHVLFQLKSGFSLSSILHSWKGYSAHKANQLLNRTGEFWQREYFDRIVKSERQLEFTLRYILNNPVKAGLCKQFFQWPWTGCSEEMQTLAKRFFL
jgi:REP element-mobilizing transposase RayT